MRKYLLVVTSTLTNELETRLRLHNKTNLKYGTELCCSTFSIQEIFPYQLSR